MTAGPAAGVVVYRNARGATAIDQYSRHLVSALCAAGAPARYAPDGLSSVSGADLRPAWILVQYNPFSYGRWGVAPRLALDAVALRRRWPRTPFVVTVHEAWVAMADWRSALMGAYQRAQLRLLLASATAVIVVRARLARELGRTCAHIPVASNIEPVAITARAARARLGVVDKLVVALFGTGHPDRALDYPEAAIAALAAQRGPERVQVLNLGRNAPSIAAPPGVVVVTPGGLDSGEVSLRLRASDILLLATTDGVSTRRGTLMAGLAHGVPVLGLRGFNTERLLVDHPDAIVLTPAGDRGRYARTAVELTDDPARLHAMGDAGRRVYERDFDWPVLAQRVIAVLNHPA